MDYLRKLQEILADVTERDITEFDEMTLASTLVGDSDNSLRLSSIDYVDFLCRLEAEFDVVYQFDKYIVNVDDVMEMIMGKEDEC